VPQTLWNILSNHVPPPITEAEFDLMYSEGISSTGALLDLALEKQIIEGGKWKEGGSGLNAAPTSGGGD
jgi:recombination protein RecA